ncbi:transposase [Nocardia sp. NPDC004604]|uniref:transposase n=1 Tax=Nocardia sp. NPDC004604 TaxID=3157013 RepID=UPI0033A23B53
MVQRLGTDHQRLQQFVTSSPWDVVVIRKVLSRKACDVIGPEPPRTGQGLGATAWCVTI